VVLLDDVEATLARLMSQPAAGQSSGIEEAGGPFLGDFHGDEYGVDDPATESSQSSSAATEQALRDFRLQLLEERANVARTERAMAASQLRGARSACAPPAASSVSGLQRSRFIARMRQESDAIATAASGTADGNTPPGDRAVDIGSVDSRAEAGAANGARVVHDAAFGSDPTALNLGGGDQELSFALSSLASEGVENDNSPPQVLDWGEALSHDGSAAAASGSLGDGRDSSRTSSGWGDDDAESGARASAGSGQEDGSSEGEWVEWDKAGASSANTGAVDRPSSPNRRNSLPSTADGVPTNQSTYLPVFGRSGSAWSKEDPPPEPPLPAANRQDCHQDHARGSSDPRGSNSTGTRKSSRSRSRSRSPRHVGKAVSSFLRRSSSADSRMAEDRGSSVDDRGCSSSGSLTDSDDEATVVAAVEAFIEAEEQSLQSQRRILDLEERAAVARAARKAPTATSAPVRRV